ncbi:uncharacterized protein LOC124281066 [Haliotis rubra]|uniref:uncharacterized protein LOC124281066 n=1 Tax=Haliotis rubra TaxID=36100 RepID=UPI001EE5F917|nr:uncharacterized protein LOC124281066 [Haliotis rubra]
MDSVTAVKVCCGIALMVWCLRCGSASHDVVSYYMEDICGHTVSFSSEEENEFLFSLTRDESSFAANMYCRVEIVADPRFQIMFKFTRLDFSSSSHYLSLYSRAIGWSYGIDRYINDLLHTPVSTTPSNKGILLFRSGTTRLSGGMSVIVTMFKQANQFAFFNSNCDDGYFLCENDRCISEDLVCNTRDNCGDESDEWDDCSLLPWWIYFLIAFGVIFTLCGITICVCKSFKKKAERPSVAVDPRQQISTIQTGFSYQSANTVVSPAQSTQHGSVQMGVSSGMTHYQPGMSSPYNNQQMNPHQVPPHSPVQIGASYPAPHTPMTMPVSPPGFIPHSPSQDPPAYSGLAMNPSAPPLGTIMEDKPGRLPK